MTHSNRGGIINWVCLGLVFVLAAAALLPAASRAHEMEDRITCAKNLHRIGQAIFVYSNNETRNGMALPRVKFDLDDADHPKFFTNWNQPNSFGAGAPVNDITASLYLVLKNTQNDLKPSELVCPASPKQTLTFGNQGGAGGNPVAASSKAISNFPGLEYLSYSIQNMFPSKDALATGWRWNAAVAPDFVLLADINPGGKAVTTAKPDSPRDEMKKANSPNHGNEGQNVLYGDGRVEWQTTPFCGAAAREGGPRDNIYCRAAGAAGDPIVGPSVNNLDNILLPTADYQPASK